MAITGNKVSLKNIIAKVFRDLAIKEEVEHYDFIEWGVEALEQIGVYEQLDNNVEEIDINFYKGELPLGIVSINQISYRGTPLTPSSNSFGPQEYTFFDSRADTGLSVNEDKIKNKVFNGSPIEYNHKLTYQISGGYIKVPFEDGKILISYQSLPVDCEGFPTVPDDVSFREAVYRYIVYKYLYPKWVIGQVSSAVYQDAEAKWQWYCGQAGAKAQIPDANKLENIARNYISLKPNIYKFNTFFENGK